MEIEQNKLIKLSDEEYFGIDALNFSTLKAMYKSAKSFQYEKNNPTPPSQAQTFGSAVHTYLLDPEEFEKQFFLHDGKIDRRTKEGKEVVEQAGGREIVGMEIVECVDAIKSVLGDMSNYTKEHCVIWKDETFLKKAKIDAYDESTGILYDIKTTTDASINAFKRVIYNYKYYAQASYYCDAILATGKQVNGFRLVAVEKERPYEVVVFELTLDYLQYGRREVKILENKLQYAQVFNTWLGVGGGETITVDVPTWADNSLIMEEENNGH